MWTREPLIKILPHSDGWELATEAKFSDTSGFIVIPEGFETDFASIPTFFQNLIKVNGKHRLAALLHDYLYSVGGDIGFNKLTRKQCDTLFLEEMQKANVKWVKRKVMYRIVRIFGGSYWIKQQGNKT